MSVQLLTACHLCLQAYQQLHICVEDFQGLMQEKSIIVAEEKNEKKEQSGVKA